MVKLVKFYKYISDGLSKYEELCKKQSVTIYKNVSFDKEMPNFEGKMFKR